MDNIDELKEGYKTFRKIKFKENEDRFKSLIKHGQSPKTLFIGCSDSRVMPAMITNSGAGDLFVFRNIGNFVPPFKPDDDFHATAAAVEYAVSVLEVSDIIICGHSDCGAIKAVHQDIKPNDENMHTIKWLQLGKKAKEEALSALPNASLKDILEYTEKRSIVFQLENLMTYPGVQRAISSNKLFLHGWHYDIATGDILYYDDNDMLFKELYQIQIK